MTHEERTSINNGIWLCNVCARLIDVNESAYPVSLLHRWKEKAEERQRNGDNVYKNEVRSRQLESIYSPIHRKIMDFYNTYFYDEGYLGIDEDTLVEIIQIIQENQRIADSDLLNWQKIREWAR